jgi:hypothetical protein
VRNTRCGEVLPCGCDEVRFARLLTFYKTHYEKLETRSCACAVAPICPAWHLHLVSLAHPWMQPAPRAGRRLGQQGLPVAKTPACRPRSSGRPAPMPSAKRPNCPRGGGPPRPLDFSPRQILRVLFFLPGGEFWGCGISNRSDFFCIRFSTVSAGILCKAFSTLALPRGLYGCGGSSRSSATE